MGSWRVEMAPHLTFSEWQSVVLKLIMYFLFVCLFSVFPGVGSTFFCRGRLLFFFLFLLGKSAHQLDEMSVYGNPEFLHIYFIEKLSGKQKCQLEHVFLPENFSISACYIRNEKKTPNLSLGGRLGRFLHRKIAVKALCSLDVITTFPWVKC